ncbi:hypothetical protein P22_1984 [Propionispora sp. 2/2-37]|uniref:DNA cytosine methyltransferase n=1 Tax=Propionispora sp. 2/2-37 TaxID=1677858 RepID=UPI0006BB7A6A|nr:DNA cytosine methyltransferase [Propionispora sp. 2/2-37]CUH95898.1 hypothetical protein P22_1984 [Propionispora sp. 2/2-37]
MKLGSLFDGIGGWPLAATRYDIVPVWASEIEAFPIEVTKIRFPNMKHLGDITKINGAEIEPVDVITLGSPCQDLSIAGNRNGMQIICPVCGWVYEYRSIQEAESCPLCCAEPEQTRSNLFHEGMRIIGEMREATNGEYPRFAVWENVPGAFSSNKGADFRAVLEEVTEAQIPIPRSGRWASAGVVRGNGVEVAWRVLDARYWGVPQRRKRIFLVADFAGQCAAKILFKPESLRRNTAESGSPREGTAGGFEDSVGTTGRLMFSCAGYSNYQLGELAATQRAAMAKQTDVDLVVAFHTVAAIDCRSLYESEELSGTLQAKSGGGYSLNYQNPVRIDYAVRRLTPLECERLQGFPDGWTDIPGASDTARYKALGNGMAQPCPDYIMQGIAEVLYDFLY